MIIGIPARSLSRPMETILPVARAPFCRRCACSCLRPRLASAERMSVIAKPVIASIALAVGVMAREFVVA